VFELRASCLKSRGHNSSPRKILERHKNEMSTFILKTVLLKAKLWEIKTHHCQGSKRVNWNAFIKD
jgi:hypothetical protein